MQRAAGARLRTAVPGGVSVSSSEPNAGYAFEQPIAGGGDVARGRAVGHAFRYVQIAVHVLGERPGGLCSPKELPLAPLRIRADFVDLLNAVVGAGGQ